MLEREQLLSIFDSINEVIFVVDVETWEVLFTNKFMKNLYGKELIGGLCYQEVHGLARPCDHCKTDVVKGALPVSACVQLQNESGHA